MVGGNPPIMWRFLKRIKIRRTYFYGRHVDLVWYGRREIIQRKIKGDCGSFFYIQYYNFILDMARKVLLGKKCVCDIKEIGRKHGSKLYFDYCNGKWLMYFHVSCWHLVIFRI